MSSWAHNGNFRFGLWLGISDELGKSEVVLVDELPTDQERAAISAADNCPERAIIVVDDRNQS
jgi:ferredoxin